MAQIAIDVDGVLVLANAHARSTFGLSAADLGRPLKDLEISYRPVDLRSNLELAFSERRTVSLTPEANASVPRTARAFEVQITPLLGRPTAARRDDHLPGRHAAAARRGRARASKRELETAYEELQSTVEELETTNEELQSTNEELETTNEELQSANEELETMNEELQSTNEELETINDEVRQRSLELNEINAFLETILSSMGVAVIVIDREQRVQIWNAESTEFWGVRSDEAHGQHLFGLDIGLPLDGVRTPLRRVLAGTDARAEVQLEARNRRGRRVRVNVTLLGPRARPGRGHRRDPPHRARGRRRPVGRRRRRGLRRYAASRPCWARPVARRARERAITVAVRDTQVAWATRSASIRARSAAMSAASSGARSCVGSGGSFTAASTRRTSAGCQAAGIASCAPSEWRAS